MRAHPVLLLSGMLLLCTSVASVGNASTPKARVRFINTVPNSFLTGKATQVDPDKGPLHPKTLGKNLGYSLTTRLKKALKEGTGLFSIFEGDGLLAAEERPVSAEQGINVFAVKGNTSTADILVVPWARSMPDGNGVFNFVQTIADAPTLELEVQRSSDSMTTTYGNVLFKDVRGSYVLPESYEFHLRVQGTATVLDSGTFTPVVGQGTFLVFIGTYDTLDKVPITHRIVLDSTKK